MLRLLGSAVPQYNLPHTTASQLAAADLLDKTMSEVGLCIAVADGWVDLQKYQWNEI